MCVRVTLAPALIKVNREKNLFLCLALARKANNNLFIAKAYFLYQLNVSENSGEAVFYFLPKFFRCLCRDLPVWKLILITIGL